MGTWAIPVKSRVFDPGWSPAGRKGSRADGLQHRERMASHRSTAGDSAAGIPAPKKSR